MRKGIYATAGRVFTSYKNSAETRGHPFLLEFDLFAEIIQQNCYYCGEPPSNYDRSNSVYYNGVDRINSDIGYCKENVVACYFNCNRSKSKMSQGEFLVWAKQLAK